AFASSMATGPRSSLIVRIATPCRSCGSDAVREVRQNNGEVVRHGAVYVYWFVSENRLSNDHIQRMSWLALDLVRTGELQRWAYIGCLAACHPGQEEATYRRLERLIQAIVPEFQTTAGPALSSVQRPAHRQPVDGVPPNRGNDIQPLNSTRLPALTSFVPRAGRRLMLRRQRIIRNRIHQNRGWRTVRGRVLPGLRSPIERRGYRGTWLMRFFELFGGTREIQPLNQILLYVVLTVPAAMVLLAHYGFYNRPLVSTRRQTAFALFKVQLHRPCHGPRYHHHVPDAREQTGSRRRDSFRRLQLRAGDAERGIASDGGYEPGSKRGTTNDDWFWSEPPKTRLSYGKTCANATATASGSWPKSMSTNPPLIRSSMCSTNSPRTGSFSPHRNTVFGQLEKVIQACELEGSRGLADSADFLQDPDLPHHRRRPAMAGP
ncbi:MAG: hypothetical protein V9G14_05675, partial [Cypionkella sp.]